MTEKTIIVRARPHHDNSRSTLSKINSKIINYTLFTGFVCGVSVGTYLGSFGWINNWPLKFLLTQSVLISSLSGPTINLIANILAINKTIKNEFQPLINDDALKIAFTTSLLSIISALGSCFLSHLIAPEIFSQNINSYCIVININ